MNVTDSHTALRNSCIFVGASDKISETKAEIEVIQ